MSWTPISNTPPQYEENGIAASGYYIKFYVAGTTTPTAMATDSTGVTLLDKCQLDTEGYPINGSSAAFLPHIDIKYKIALFRNEADADSNNLANAAWDIDNLFPFFTDASIGTGFGQIPLNTDIVYPVDTYADLVLLEPTEDGQWAYLGGHTNQGLGGGSFYSILNDPLAGNNGTKAKTAGGHSWNRSIDGIITPSMFGLVKDGVGANPTDNTVGLLEMIAAAGTSDEIVFDGMYAGTGINITRALSRGVTIRGNKAPPDLGIDNDTPGISAVGDQAMILTIGETTGTCEGGSLENFAIYGNDKAISLAGFIPERWSQGSMRNVVVSNVKGRGVLPRKWEDMEVYNFSVLKCGTVLGKEGGLMFGESPDLQTNVVTFFGGRFEWIDGPMVGLATSIDADSATSHVLFVGTKFEAGERDGYGTTRATNSVWDFRPNAQFRVQNIRFIDCWIAQAQQCAQVLHLGASDGVSVDNLKMSSPTGDGISTFLMDESGGTDARDFAWKNTSVINTSGDYSSFTIGSSSNCINPSEYERPTGYTTNGSRLANNNPLVMDANLIGISGRMLPNTNNVADPVITNTETVCALGGSSTSSLCFLSSTRYDPDIIQSGFSPDLYDSILEIKVRIKKGGNAADARIEIRADGSFVTQAQFSNTSFEWVTLYANLRGLSGTLSITLSTFNQADHVVYIDAVDINQTREYYSNAIPIAGAYEAGEVVRFNAPSSGNPPGAVCTVSGTPGTWANMANLA